MGAHSFASYSETMARSLLIYRLTGSATILGIMSLTLALPGLIVNLFGGAIADRVQKKYLLIIGPAFSTIFTLIIALALSSGYLSKENTGSWWLIMVTAGIQGTLNGFVQPTHMSIIPELVKKQQVMNGISLSTTVQTTFRLISPAMSGFLIDAYGFTFIYYLIVGLYIISAIFPFFLPRTGKSTTRGGNVLKDVVNGFRYIRKDGVILLIVIFGLLNVASGQPFNTLLPIFTEDILKVGASGFGIVTSFISAGALVSSLILASLPNRKRGKLLLISGIILGIAILGFCWSNSWYLSLAIVFFVGVGMLLYTAISSTMIQSYAQPEYRGRMQSFLVLGNHLAFVSTFLAAVLADSIGVQWAVTLPAMLIIFVSVGYFAFARRITKLE